MTITAIRKAVRPSVVDVNVEALEKELRSTVDGEVRFDLASKAVYSTDASNYRQIPIGVVIPRSKEAVEAAVAACRHHGAPIVSRGGGTGLCGQTCNTAIVIDFSKYLNRILEIAPEARYARVEPGTILDDLRELAENPYHLTYGPDPATHTHCTFGGMIGNDSCGVHSVMAGRTADNVIELEILTYDGLRTRVGVTGDAEYSRILAEGGRKADIYRKLNNLRSRYAPLIRERYPKIPRRVSGYNLDNLLPENGFHVAQALVGSESTCVMILEATVRLVYSPPGRALLVLGYPDVYTAGDHVMEILQYRPIGLEGMDDVLIEYMRKKGMHPGDIKLLPEGKGWLLVEFGGETRQQAREAAQNAMRMLSHVPHPPQMRMFDDPAQETKLWKVRESGLGATANVPDMPLAWEGWEDAAVPPDRIGDYLRDFRALLNKYNYSSSLYGHFGGGCIHCRISFDLFTQEGIRKWTGFLDEASSLVVRYGGSFSAEHGDGQSKAIFLPKMYGPELMDAFREYKSIWDPEWKMNPGKVIDAYRPDQNLRLGPQFNPKVGDTHFQYPDDQGSFARAVLRCVGVGDCRRTHDAFMCPSFVATREEEHTTRGRARALFEMMRGEEITDGWKSDDVLKTLDLCLACMGCKKECPVNVDMATYKAEFLSHYYEGRLRPREHYSMGLIGYWAHLGAIVPELANFLTQTPALQPIAKALAGISPHRPIPKFARETFSHWHRAHRSPVMNGRAVVLYPDVFNDCFTPNSLKAAQRVLERWGYRVLVPSEPVGAIRPLIHYGMLNLAKKKIRQTLNILHPFIAHGLPMIVLEPSTATVFRDDVRNLLPQNEDGRRLKDSTFLLSEFVEQKGLRVPQLGGKAIFHGHCHQKASLNVDDARHMLRKMGLEIEEPQPGCCGMAGSFGLETRHYDLSMKIAKEHLLPAIEEAPRTTYLVADGFSCRSQIQEGTGRRGCIRRSCSTGHL
ncbi:MAG TPA: FAD-binding and (Fe-S)-binding domain-containing protein [bacterium]|jgi:FAD/FMN-containing dehydrogenase/Fe-S oxidoreductase